MVVVAAVVAVLTNVCLDGDNLLSSWFDGFRVKVTSSWGTYSKNVMLVKHACGGNNSKKIMQKCTLNYFLEVTVNYIHSHFFFCFKFLLKRTTSSKDCIEKVTCSLTSSFLEIADTTATGCFWGLRICPKPKLGRCRCKLLPEEECSNENPIRDVPVRKYSDKEMGDPLLSFPTDWEELLDRWNPGLRFVVQAAGPFSSCMSHK